MPGRDAGFRTWSSVHEVVQEPEQSDPDRLDLKVLDVAVIGTTNAVPTARHVLAPFGLIGDVPWANRT